MCEAGPVPCSHSNQVPCSAIPSLVGSQGLRSMEWWLVGQLQHTLPPNKALPPLGQAFAGGLGDGLTSQDGLCGLASWRSPGGFMLTLEASFPSLGGPACGRHQVIVRSFRGKALLLNTL